MLGENGAGGISEGPEGGRSLSGFCVCGIKGWVKDSKKHKSARKEAYLESIPLASIDTMMPKTKHMQTP